MPNAKKPVRGSRVKTNKAKSVFKPCRGCPTPAACKKAGKCKAKK